MSLDMSSALPNLYDGFGTLQRMRKRLTPEDDLHIKSREPRLSTSQKNTLLVISDRIEKEFVDDLKAKEKSVNIKKGASCKSYVHTIDSRMGDLKKDHGINMYAMEEITETSSKGSQSSIKMFYK